MVDVIMRVTIGRAPSPFASETNRRNFSAQTSTLSVSLRILSFTMRSERRTATLLAWERFPARTAKGISI
jgi:hypothetical protein